MGNKGPLLRPRSIGPGSIRTQILFYSNLFYSILFYFILFYSFFLFYSILFYSILFYSILFYSILFYSILFYFILFCSVLFYSILFLSHSELGNEYENNSTGLEGKQRDYKYRLIVGTMTMNVGPCHHGMAHPRVGDWHPTRRVDVNKLNKQPRTGE